MATEQAAPESTLARIRSAAVISGPPLVLRGLLATSVLAASAAAWEQARRGGRPIWKLVAVGALTPWVWRLLHHTKMMRLGATWREVQEALPGDELVADRQATELTHAITLRARPEDIWPWLAQMGSGERGGFYSHDWLERLAGGAPVYNAERILPEYQHPEVGDLISPLSGEQEWRVLRVEPERVFVFGTRGFSYGFVLRPLDEEHTRLLVRLRMSLARLGPLGGALFNLHHLPHLIMQRKMLKELRRRAEQTARQREAVAREAVDSPRAAPRVDEGAQNVPLS
jgi:hypothetical protein